MHARTKRTLWTLALAAIVALAAALPAAAQDDPWTSPGGYMIIGGVNAFENFQNTGPDDFDDSWGFVVRGGYRFNRWLAAEGSLEFLTGFDVDVTVPPGAPPEIPDPLALTADGGNFTANIKAYAPWFGRFQPYGMVGIGGMWARLRTRFATGTICTPGFPGWWCTGTYTQLGDTGGFLAKFGGGAEYWVTRDFSFVIDATYNLPTGDPQDFQSISLNWGGKFHF